VKIGKEAFYRQLEMPLGDAYELCFKGADRKLLHAEADRRHLSLRRKTRPEMAE